MSFIVIGLMASFTAALVLALVMGSVIAERRQIHRSLRTIRAFEVGPYDLRARELSTGVTKRVVLPGLGRLGRLARRFTPTSALDRLDSQLKVAGSPEGWDAERLLAYKIVTTSGLLFAGFTLLSILDFPLLRGLPLVLTATALGYYAPEWLLRSQADSRQKLIQRQLPDSLDLLSITVEAGLGFDAAMQRVSKQIGGPLGQEFHRVVQEMQLGKGRSDALRDMGERTTVQELRSFVLAMVQADIFGIPIASVLHVQARELRIKRRQRAEERAQKIPVKILFPLIFGIFPMLMIVIIGPAAIQIRAALLQ